MAGFNVGSVVAHIKADVSDFQKGIKTVKNETGGLSSKLAAMGKVGVAAVATVGAAAGAAAVAFGTMALKQAAAFEQTKMAFSTLLGDGEKAKKLLDEIAESAKKTPFELPQLEEGAKRLLAYGVEADDLVPTLERLGDVSAALGVEKMPQLILAFGQIKAKGRLMGTELRQLTETGFNLADAMGITNGELEAMVSRGEVSFDDVNNAFITATEEGGKFFGMMEGQSQTLNGQISNLKDEFNLLAREVGQYLLPVAKTLVEFAREVLIPGLKTVSDWFINDGVPKVQALGVVFDWLKQQGQIVMEALTAFYEKHKEDFEYIFNGLMDFIDWFIKTVKEWWDNWGGYILALVKGVWNVIVATIQLALEIIINVVKFFIAIFKGDWSAAWDAVRGIVKAGVDFLKVLFESLKNIVWEAMKAVYNSMVDWFNKAWEKAKEIAKKIRDAIKSAFDKDKRDSPSVVDNLKDIVRTSQSLLGQVSVPNYRKQISSELGQVNPAGALAGVGTTININLDGAIIADELSAQSMAETIGDSIVRRVKQNVRI